MESYLLYLIIGASIFVVVSLIQWIREKANIVRLTARDAESASDLKKVNDSSSTNKLSRAALEEQIKMLISQSKKIEAIKLLRMHSNLGLKDSKDAIDAMERSGCLVIPGIEASGMSATVEPDSERSIPDLEEVKRLIRDGRKVDAVKLVRERTGLGLEEAKAEVDRLARLV